MPSFSQRLTSVNSAIHTAALAANRDPKSIQLIAVSKTFPAEDIQSFYHLGLRHFGENYIQEWAQKQETLPQNIVWHIIGPIQSNKTKIVAQYAHWVHTLDRLKIAERLSAQRPSDLPPLNVCIEVNISGAAQKHGIPSKDVRDLALAIKDLPHLTLRGLMAIPSAKKTEQIAQEMKTMYDLFHALKDEFTLDTLSMGMSSDLGMAIENGATHVRIGTALFGHRDYAPTSNT